MTDWVTRWIRTLSHARATALFFVTMGLCGVTGCQTPDAPEKSPAQHEASEFHIVIVEAHPERGFDYPYLLRIPTTPVSAERAYLVVESNNTGVDDDLRTHQQRVVEAIGGLGIGPNIATALQVPLLMPVLPRSAQQSYKYTHALDTDTLNDGENPAKRLDRQLMNMIDDAAARLAERGMPVNNQFALVGFSASGTFSNRFAFLHPQRLMAVVSGAVNAMPMLPVATLNGCTLDYPLGIGDLHRYTETGFDLATWKALPQMVFMGALDKNDAVAFDDAYSSAERDTVHRCVGEAMDARWRQAMQVYVASGANVSLTTYGQVGHWTDGRINGDIVNFVEMTMRRHARRLKER